MQRLLEVLLRLSKALHKKKKNKTNQLLSWISLYSGGEESKVSFFFGRPGFLRTIAGVFDMPAGRSREPTAGFSGGASDVSSAALSGPGVRGSVSSLLRFIIGGGVTMTGDAISLSLSTPCLSPGVMLIRALRRNSSGFCSISLRHLVLQFALPAPPRLFFD